MGNANNHLIAPAILYSNPNITKGEFVELLEKTHSSSYREYGLQEPWTYFDSRTEEERYHSGLEGLARILRLEYSDKFNKFQEPHYDENNLSVAPPILEEPLRGTFDKYVVFIHKENKIEESRTVYDGAGEKLNVGDIWTESQNCDEDGIIIEILKEDFCKENDLSYAYEMIVKPISRIYETEEFTTKEELYTKWPEFSPEFMYDWSKTNESFKGTNDFLWVQKNDKYSIDSETFNRIPAFPFGYTDLILTVEAIKQNAWKLLSYNGSDYTYQFLKDFPEVETRYRKAVWDAHTSLFAKKQRMTVTELLYFRNKPKDPVFR